MSTSAAGRSHGRGADQPWRQVGAGLLTFIITLSALLAWNATQSPHGKPTEVPPLRSMAPGDAVPPGMRDTPVASAAARETTVPASVDRWWCYEAYLSRSYRFDTKQSDVQLSGGPSSLEEALAAASRYTLEQACWFVGEADNRRFVTFLTVDSYQHRQSRRWFETASAGVGSSDVFVVDAMTRAPEIGSLFDSDGRPLGPIDAPRCCIAFDPGFSGVVSAPGCLPEAFDVAVAGAPVVVALRRAAYLRGRFVGAPVGAGASLILHDVEMTGIRAPPDEVAVTMDGTFAVGPIAAGRRRIFLECESALLPGGTRDVELRAGENDLGDIQLGALGTRHLRIVAPGRALPTRLFVECSFAEGERPARMDAPEMEVGPTGIVTIRRVREGTVRVHIWTRDGWSGDPVYLATGATAEDSPRVVELQPPSDFVVRVETAPFSIPEGSRIVMHPTGGLPASSRWRPTGAKDLPARRIRERSIARDGSARFPALWSGECSLTVVASGGATLVEHQLRIEPGQRDVARIDLRGALGMIELRDAGGSAPRRRFAVVRETDGSVARASIDASGSASVVVMPGTYSIGELEAHAGLSAAIRKDVHVEAGLVVVVEL